MGIIQSEKLLGTISEKALEGKIIKQSSAITIRGRVTKIWKEREDTNSIVTGIKGKYQTNIERNPMIKGSNGTYLEIGEYLGMRLYINVTLYETPLLVVNGKKYRINKRVRIECYEDVRKVLGKNVYGRKALTERRMDYLREMLESKKFNFLLYPVYTEDNSLYIWMQIILWFQCGEEKCLPFEGFISIKEMEDLNE